MYALLVWLETQSTIWLNLSAVSIGLALSTKYLGLAGAATVAMILAAWLVVTPSRPWHRVGYFLLLAFIFGSPWYMLNLVRAGNPVYPFIWGGPGWDQARLGYLMTYLRSFGGSNALWMLPLAPFRLFADNAVFSTFLSSIEYPSPLFLVAILVPLARPPRLLRLLALVTGLRFLLWGLSSQQTRFLLPLFPALAVLSVYTLDKLLGAVGKASIQRVLLSGTLGGLLLVTAVYQGVFWFMTQPGNVIVGMETEDSFLRRNVTIYPAQAFIREFLPLNARALMLWDGAMLYCDARCVPDAEQSIWTLVGGPGKNGGRSRSTTPCNGSRLSRRQPQLDQLLPQS